MYYLSTFLIPNVNTSKKYFICRYKSKVMKYLNVAEKRDAAKNIAAHLSRGTCQMVNGTYVFDAEVLRQKSKMVMTAVSGHLLNYKFTNEFVNKSWKNCAPKVLFDEQVDKTCTKNSEKIKNKLQIEIRDCDGLIIWTDCDREGENIGFEIIDVCKARKRNINIYRAKFSEITSQSVTRALNNLESPNIRISKAVDVRQELDLRIGAAFTRFQTLRLQNTFQHPFQDQIISYGSCQFPTLGFVVERYRAIADFISEPFWKLQVTHNCDNLSTVFSWDRGRLFDEDVCKLLHKICSEAGVARVEDVNTKPKNKWRPLPLDTIELEKLASRKLNITAKETMALAEKLYIAGIISYPRTETNKFSKDINLKKLVELQKDDPNWGEFARNVVSQGPNPRQGNKSDEAHPPIHPTRYDSGLSGNEKRLYEFIARSFLACCSKDAKGQETTVTVNVGDEIFRASGLIIEERNYLDVYPYDKWSAKEIAAYEAGKTFVPTKIEIVPGKTSPPQLLTEADLIALMEKHGIGTDATHADHIEKIKYRKYVVFQENADTDDASTHRQSKTKVFMPTKLGMGLVRAYDAMELAITKPNLRAQFENDLKLICEGRKEPEEVLREQISKYKEIYSVIENNVLKLDHSIRKYVIPDSQRAPRPGTDSTTSRSVSDSRRVNGAAGSTTATNRSNSTFSNESVLCKCNQPAVQLTCKKQNHNKGKKFFKCQNNACDFFKWDDNSTTSRNTNPPPPAAARPGDASAATRRAGVRRCSKCREPGHTIKNCPRMYNTSN